MFNLDSNMKIDKFNFLTKTCVFETSRIRSASRFCSVIARKLSKDLITTCSNGFIAFFKWAFIRIRCSIEIIFRTFEHRTDKGESIAAGQIIPHPVCSHNFKAVFIVIMIIWFSWAPVSVNKSCFVISPGPLT